MRNKKFSALLLAASMLVSLVVPVSAADDGSETDSLTILTQNTVHETEGSLKNLLTLDKLATITGKTVNAYPTDGYVPTIATTSLGSYAQSGQTAFATEEEVKNRLTDGNVGADQIWNWVNDAGTGVLTIDLGGEQSVEQLLFWIIVRDADDTYTETLWNDYKDTHIIEKWNISTSVDGKTFTPVVTDATPTSATKDSTFMYFLQNGNVDKISHVYGSTFNATSARYIKLAVKCQRGQEQFRSPEVMALGKVTATKTVQVISGNTFNNDVLNKINGFSGYKVELGSAAAHLETKVAATSVANDLNGALENATILTDGNISGMSCLFSKWDSGEKPVYTVDLGGEQEVESVLVFDKVKDDGADPEFTAEEWKTKEAEMVEQYKDVHRIGNIEIKVSDDGVNWSEAVYNADPRKTATADSTFIYTYTKDGNIVFDKLIHGHACNFKAVKARYIQVTMTRSSNSIMLCELAVLGTASSLVDRYLLTGNGSAPNKDSNVSKTKNFYKGYGYNVTTASRTVPYMYTSGAVNREPKMEVQVENQGYRGVMWEWLDANVTGNTTSSESNYSGSEEIDGTTNYYINTPVLTSGFNEGRWGCTSWGSNVTTVIFDLGKICEISGVDFEDYRDSDDNQGAKKVKVEVSNTFDMTTGTKTSTPKQDNNGNTYDLIKYNGYVDNTTWTKAYETTTNDVNKFAYGEKYNVAFHNFAPVNGRYVKVTITGGKYQTSVSEIALVGSEPTSATTPVFVNGDGDTYEVGFGNDGLKAKTNFSGGNGTLVVAWYNTAKDLLNKVWVKEGTGDVEIDLSAEEEGIVEDGGILKAFAFGSMADAELLSSTVTELDLAGE